MRRTIPEYIAAARVQEGPLKAWNDADPRGAYGDEVPRLARMVVRISDRGSMLLAAALAEWVAFRLQPHSPERLLFDYIDAVRACVVDLAYTDVEANPEQSLHWKDWKGPVRGPMAAAARKLGEVVEQVELEEPSDSDVVYLANLVEHTLADVKPFRKWRNWAIDRLLELASIDDDRPLGDPLPIEMLNPSGGFDPGQSRKLLREFLAGLDPKTNRWLRTPAQMKKAGFKGKPYEL
jgi:hypothetical protein